MAEWVLILWFIGYNSGGATTVSGFDSEAGCQKAAETVVHNKPSLTTVYSYCVEIEDTPHAQ